MDSKEIPNLHEEAVRLAVTQSHCFDLKVESMQRKHLRMIMRFLK